jgi:hypothetical protein
VTPAVIVALIAALVLIAVPASGATIAVDCAHVDLQQKIDSAAPGSILAIKGTCVGNFVVAKNLTLKGNPTATLDGNDVDRTLTITGTRTVHLISLEITGGYAESAVLAKGGGIFSAGGVLTLSKVRVHGNVAVSGGTTTEGGSAWGGGISFAGGTLNVTDSKITDNWAISTNPHLVAAIGGGIQAAGTLSIVRSSVSANRVLGDSSDEEAHVSGGGIAHAGGSVTLTSSHVDGNRATGHGLGDGQSTTAEGGGVSINGGTTLSITHSTVSGNRLTARMTGVDSTADATGGAIRAQFAKGTASDSSFLGNRITGVSSEGPAFALGGALSLSPNQGFTLLRTRIVGSEASADAGLNGEGYGGGIWHSGTLSLVSSTVAANTIHAHGRDQFGEGEGGGIRGDSGKLTVRNSTVDANRLLVGSDSADSTASGGGISASGGLAISSSTVSGNVASAGSTGRAGGLSLDGSATDSIVNSTIASNLAAGFHSNGGGIETKAHALNITNSTVARNRAATAGGLIVTGGATALKATIVAKNTANQSPDCKGTISSAGHNLIGKTAGCTGFGSVASDKLNKDPKLGLLAANGGPTRTLSLLNGSPALNAIPPAQCDVTVDQRGVHRPQGANCDIGAFERAA